jgi:hypothetical protein
MRASRNCGKHHWRKLAYREWARARLACLRTIKFGAKTIRFAQCPWFGVMTDILLKTILPETKADSGKRRDLDQA